MQNKANFRARTGKGKTRARVKKLWREPLTASRLHTLRCCRPVVFDTCGRPELSCMVGTRSEWWAQPTLQIRCGREPAEQRRTASGELTMRTVAIVKGMVLAGLLLCAAGRQAAAIEFQLQDTMGREVRAQDYQGRPIFLEFGACW